MSTPGISNSDDLSPKEKIAELRASLRLLCVDDDPSFGRIMAKIAKGSRIPFTHLKTAEEIISTESRTFNVAIVDCDLGVTNGIDTAKYLEHCFKDIVIILVSQSELEVPKWEWPGCVKGFIGKEKGHRFILASAIHAYGVSYWAKKADQLR